jgi:hypothetical protein
MPRFRLTISGMSAVILVCAILLAAARSPNDLWSTAAFSASLLVLGVALIGALFARRARRTYWAGFAVLGWGYMLIVFGPWCDTHIAPLLITRSVFELVHFRFQGDLPERPYVRVIAPGLVMFGYQQIAHSLTAVLLGLLGGTLARRFAAPEVAAGPSGRGLSDAHTESRRSFSGPVEAPSGAIPVHAEHVPQEAQRRS